MELVKILGIILMTEVILGLQYKAIWRKFEIAYVLRSLIVLLFGMWLYGAFDQVLGG